jgi:hypothetical protein
VGAARRQCLFGRLWYRPAYCSYRPLRYRHRQNPRGHVSPA